MPRKRDGLPDRWLDFTKIGQTVFATRFVPFKTPLAGDKFNHLLDESQRFSPDDLLNCLPDLGLVIDLTNTNRYYPRHHITRRGVQYRKLRCEGHVVPSEEVVSEFCDVVNEFVESSPSPRPRPLVGVHCTHGLNRTGFLVCSYMIRCLGFRPRDAIAAFGLARGHRLGRPQLLHRLLISPAPPQEDAAGPWDSFCRPTDEPKEDRAEPVWFDWGWDSDCPRGNSYCDDYYDENCDN